MRHLGISCILVDTGRDRHGVVFVLVCFSLFNRNNQMYADLFVCPALTTWMVVFDHLTSFSAWHLNLSVWRPWPATVTLSVGGGGSAYL